MMYLDFSCGNDYLDNSLELYLGHGISPGGFLTAVLAGDLFLAASRADHWNGPALQKIALAIYHSMPSGSIGSYKIVEDWCKDVDNIQSTYAKRKEKEFTFNSLKKEKV